MFIWEEIGVIKEAHSGMGLGGSRCFCTHKVLSLTAGGWSVWLTYSAGQNQVGSDDGMDGRDT